MPDIPERTPPPADLHERLTGLVLGVTGSRKAEQFAEALRLRGATAVVGPMLSGDVPASDDDIVRDTEVILEAAPDWIVASSGTGMGLWIEAADRVGLGDDLRACLARARCVARGAKPAGGLVRAGTRPVWTSPRETDADVASWLGGRVITGETVAVQLHGGVTHAFRHLRDLTVDLLTVMPYRSGLPVDQEPAKALIRSLVRGELDVLVFTSPGAVRNLMTIAETMEPDVRLGVGRALAGGVAVASIGPVTSEAIEGLGGVVSITPRRFRTGDLLRSIESWHRTRRAVGASDRSSVRLDPDGGEVRVGDLAITLGPKEYAILATLLRSTGTVFRHDELVDRAWGHDAPSDPATVRHQIARLRRKLTGTGVDIQTVRRVGYRLVDGTQQRAS